MIRAAMIALAVLTLNQSASTLAAVAVFTANAERKWPADEREPFVTAEALRLMEAAAKAIAADSKLDSGKVQQAIGDFATARTALDLPGDAPASTQAALAKGALMVEALAAALHRDDAATRQQLLALKRSADAVNRKAPMRQQAEGLERYFHQAAELLRAL